MRPTPPAAATLIRAALAAGFLVTIAPPAARAQFTWNLPTGGSWNTGSNWNPALGATKRCRAGVTINNAASGSNPAQTVNRTITLDGAQTVGSITFNNDAANAFTNSLTTGSGGSLTFDATGTGPATIDVNGLTGATGNNTISAAMTLNDTLVATVNNVTASSAAGALNLTATIGGVGGFTKRGDGLATFGTGNKTDQGATILEGGRMRISAAAQPSATSSFTINAGAQLTLITVGAYTFGSGALNLNGSGATSGPFAIFPGAIRNDTNLAVTITNAVVLQSNTLLHVEGSATGSITLTGIVSGPGSLTLTAPNSSANQGQARPQRGEYLPGRNVRERGYARRQRRVRLPRHRERGGRQHSVYLLDCQTDHSGRCVQRDCRLCHIKPAGRRNRWCRGPRVLRTRCRGQRNCRWADAEWGSAGGRDLREYDEHSPCSKTMSILRALESLPSPQYPNHLAF